MNQAATTLTHTAGRASEPGPTADRDGTAMPGRIAEILGIVIILAEYGRHLLGTIEQRAVWSTFATIAQFFGTTALTAILPRLHRGIMRAVALERVLRARAERGRDLPIRPPRLHAPYLPEPEPEPESPVQEQEPPALPALPAFAGLATAIGAEIIAPPQTAAAPAPPPPRPRRRREEAEEHVTFANLPSMATLMAEVRRRPPGQTIVDILCDLGISFTLCSGPFGTRLFEAIHWHGGSLGRFMDEMRRREMKFDREFWKHPGLPLPARNREGVQRAVGFFVGDPPVDPCSPAPDAAGRLGGMSAPAAPPARTAEAASAAATACAAAMASAAATACVAAEACAAATACVAAEACAVMPAPDAPIAAAATGPP